MTDNKDSNRFFNDISHMFGSLMSTGLNSAMETRKQAEDWMDERINGLLDRGNFVRREEFNALLDTVRRLEERLEETQISATNDTVVGDVSK